MKHTTLKVHPGDNVMVALTDLGSGQQVRENGSVVALQDDVPAKHKFALEDIRAGGPVTMYGVLVGRAAVDIPRGSLLTTRNVKHAASDYALQHREVTWSPPDVSDFRDRTFMGFHRPDGGFGTANYWLVIPLVFCENRNVNVIREALVPALGYETGRKHRIDVGALVDKYRQGAAPQEVLATDIRLSPAASARRRVFPNVDGVKFLTHEGGCGGTRQDAEALCRLLAGYIIHPNVAGATVLSLGCQNAQVDLLQSALSHFRPDFDKPLYILEQQKSRSEEALIEEAVKRTFAGLMEANRAERAPAPLGGLKMGLECGGSDGFSGISANPALGYAADLLVALGGTAILSEFPELNGVEQELANRCVSDELALKFMDLMRRYHDAALRVGSGFDANPSPGNIRDGLITDAMKSAGAAKKGGTSPITDVLDYTEQAVRPGLNLLCTPGNDVESTTGLAGSGANIIVFTTGLGTPTGNPVAPVLKVSSNTPLARRMDDIIDFDAGPIITGEETIEERGRALLELVIDAASGKTLPKAVRLGQDDFIPWKRGVSL